MLLSLQVKNFAIVDEIEIDFSAGMSVLTGETGAGKSILVDAIGLVLGERGSAKLVRQGAQRAEFAAEFDIAELPAVQSMLEDKALDADGECLLRRVIAADGRSRAFVNGNSVPLSDLKKLGEHLLDIHGQHFHQSLGHRRIQRDLLDHFAGAAKLRQQVERAFNAWQEIKRRLDGLQQADTDKSNRLDLLRFQLQELESLHLGEGEAEDLVAERRKLRYSGQFLEGIADALGRLFEHEESNANSLLAEAQSRVATLAELDDSLQPYAELLDSATIQVSEAVDGLRRYLDGIDNDPARLNEVEQRLDAIQAIASKHRIDADGLPALQSELQAECDLLVNSEQHSAKLEEARADALASYAQVAAKLSDKRRKAASRFAKAVTEAMQGLGMPGGVFTVELDDESEDRPTPAGRETVEFCISANPGQAPQSLARIASGGELSRMGLAIQVIAADGSSIPTMIFDEVDSGVGGGVAEMVGLRLQQLGSTRQVLCVTHLAQVASLADQHFRISKLSEKGTTRTRVEALGADERIHEIGRMLGGVEITEKTLEHAAEMLNAAPRKRA